MIVTVDGGPDENPRYETTINCSIKYFVENGLDAFFLATNAPGRSALVIVGTKSEKWKTCHVRQSQYFLQTVKCKDPKCCSSFQSSSLQNALMPAQATKKFPKGIPYDYSCPSVDQDMIKRRNVLSLWLILFVP